MTLARRLWLLIIAAVFMAVIGAVLISSFTSKQYFAEQLFLKNKDNASVLALTLSTLEKDPVELDMYIMSQFDAGSYSKIQLIKNDGSIISDYAADTERKINAPRWFAKAFTPSVSRGQASVSDGWSQYGDLYIESDTGIAVEAIWSSTLILASGITFVGILAGLIGTFVLKIILKPLDAVVKQSEALGEMRFIQNPIPTTKEFSLIVKAMNQLTTNIERNFREENNRLDTIRRKSQYDRFTGFANQEYFLSILSGQLSFRDTEGLNCLFMVRLTAYRHLRKTMPDKELRKLVKNAAHLFKSGVLKQREQYSDMRTGALDRETFVLLLTEVHNPTDVANVLLKSFDEYPQLKAKMSVVRLHADDTCESVIDGANILIDEAKNDSLESANVFKELEIDRNPKVLSLWREKLSTAIAKGDVCTIDFPIIDNNGELVHYQSWAGVILDGEIRKSGYYTHWARYLNLLTSTELAVVNHLLQRLSTTDKRESFAVLLSGQFMDDEKALFELTSLLKKYPDEAQYLCFEFRESSAAQRPDKFESFCANFRGTGCQLGLKRVGESFSDLINVSKFGLDYVKIDSAFIHDISENEASMAFIRGFCSLAHSFDIKVYADGVNSDEDMALLKHIGVNGEVSRQIAVN